MPRAPGKSPTKLSQLKAAMRAGDDWESLVPAGVARVIRALERVPA